MKDAEQAAQIQTKGFSAFTTRSVRFGIRTRPPFPVFKLPLPQAANPRRKIELYTLRARALESQVVWKNDVAAIFANLPPVGENLHRPKTRAQDTIGTAGFFRPFHHFRCSRTRCALKMRGLYRFDMLVTVRYPTSA